MKSLLTKCARHKAIGVFMGDREISVSKVAFMPFGPVETDSASEPYDPDDLDEVLGRLLTPMLGQNRNVPVAAGLPGSKVFFSTRPVPAGNVPTAETMLQKTLCSTTISIDDLTADMHVVNVQKKPAVSIAACRKRYMAGIVGAVERLGARLMRAEPSACALVRTAVAQKKYPRRGKSVLCVFLGESHGMAAVVVGGRPLAWRTFSLPAGGETTALLSVSRTLQTQANNLGLETFFDYVVVHGRADLHGRFQEDQLPSQLEVRVVWQEGPALDGAAMAYGLAAGCQTQDHNQFDLAGSLKSRASIWEIFPWWDLTFASLLVAWMGMTLFFHAMNLDEAYTIVRAQCGNHKQLISTDQKTLSGNTETLEKKVNTVNKYLSDRGLWTEFIADIADRLPDNAALKSFSGVWTANVGRGKSAKLKKSMSFSATVPVASDEAVPREIDAFLESLRNDPLLQNNFGTVQLTDIKRTATRDRKSSLASFTVVCTSDGKPAAKPAAGGAKKKTKGK